MSHSIQSKETKTATNHSSKTNNARSNDMTAISTTKLPTAIEGKRRKQYRVFQQFPSFVEEKLFRAWSFDRQRSSPARFALFLFALFGGSGMTYYTFIDWNKFTQSENVFTLVLTTITNILLVVLCTLPARFRKCTLITHAAIYLNNILSLVRFSMLNGTTPYETSVIILFIVLQLNIIQPFTFKQMLPLYVIAVATQTTRDVYENQDIFLLAFTASVSLVFVFWEREYLTRRIWIAENRRVPAILAAQRNANHDVRNVLQEILAIVEISKGNSSQQSQQLLKLMMPEKQDEKGNTITNSATTKVEDLEEIEIVVENSNKSNKLQDVVNNEEEINQRTETVATAPRSNSMNSIDSYTGDSTNPSVLRVRTAISRMTDRLETSLRDSRNVVIDELSRLVPEIKPTNIGKILMEDYALDPLVRIEIATEFPKTVETDSDWVRTCVLNLVHNAKRHGPQSEMVTVSLEWISETSTIRITVKDQGVGPSPARSRQIWRGKGRKGGIGIDAVRSYIDGLGGTYGNDASSFWIEVPGGMTDSVHTMNKWTLRFVSNKAEQTFLSAGSKEVTVWKLIWVAIISIIIVVCFLASSNQLRNGNGNIYLNATALFALLTCNISIVYFADQPTTQWWCRNFSMFGTILLDVLSASFILMSDSVGGTAGMGEMKYLPGCFILELSAMVYGPLTNTPISTHLGPLFIIMILVRIVLSFGVYFIDIKVVLILLNATDPNIAATKIHELFFARFLHVIIAFIALYILFVSEQNRRERYVVKFSKEDLKRDLRILELSAKSRVKDVQREATRVATHSVSRCFNTLFTATLKMKELQKVIHPDQIQKKELDLCYAMVIDSKDTFIALQKKGKRTKLTEEEKITKGDEQEEITPHKDRTLSLGSSPSTSSTPSSSLDRLPTTDNINTATNKSLKTLPLLPLLPLLQSTSPSKPRVLIVDDNNFCREFAMSQISHFLGGEQKCLVDGVGTSASFVLQHLLNSEFSYDLVFMDMSMPSGVVGINETVRRDNAGLWVTKKYLLDRPSSTTKFVCLSGMGRDRETIQSCKAAGFSYPYALGKPFEWDEIQKLLLDLV